MTRYSVLAGLALHDHLNEVDMCVKYFQKGTVFQYFKKNGLVLYYSSLLKYMKIKVEQNGVFGRKHISPSTIYYLERATLASVCHLI